VGQGRHLHRFRLRIRGQEQPRVGVLHLGLDHSRGCLKHAYSAAKDETAGVYKLAGAGTSFTLFTVYAGRVSTIEIESQHLG